jgi:hypothetical protein
MKRVSAMRDEGGQVAPLAAVMLLGLVVLAGLVIDGGMLFASHRDLQRIADGAVRAGAMALDEASLRGGETTDVRLDPERAREEVRDYLTSVGFSGQSQILPGSGEVEVVLELQQRTLVMDIVGVREVTVRASSTARPRYGIDSPEEGP